MRVKYFRDTDTALLEFLGTTVASTREINEDVYVDLNAAFEDGDADVVAQAIGNVARARGMSRIANGCRLGRESLYKSLSDRGNPEFRTILSVLNAMGTRLRVEFDHNERP